MPNSTLELPKETETTLVNASNSQIPSDGHPRTFDLGFLPTPSRLRYNQDQPFHFGLGLNVFFGVASMLTVGNLYYCQPILVQLAESFDVSNERITLIPTLTQAGYATGLVLITPLGDLVRRRQLLLSLGCLIGAANLGLALSQTSNVFAGLSYLMGIVTVVPQILIPLAADLAPPERRASAISIVISGAMLGILFARVLAGVIAEFTSWRVIYGVSGGLQISNVLTMWMVVPDYPAKNNELSYFEVLRTMVRYAVSEPALIQCCLIGLLAWANFMNFWVSLTFLLTDAPYRYSTLQIGLFALVGALGVVVTPLIGRFVDKLDTWRAIGISIFVCVLFQSVFTGAAGLNVAAIIVVCFGLDAGTQMNNVSNSSRIYAIEPLARSRLNAVYVVWTFLGQVIGSSMGTRIYLKYGWRANGALALGFHGLQLLFLTIRGPMAPRAFWTGYARAGPGGGPIWAPGTSTLES